ncbi:MAG: 6,7-dimethyl-8-ribityllumazine synthase [Pseudomonadota bacterium]
MAGPTQHGALARPSFARPPRVLIVTAPYYRAIADHLIAGAEAELATVAAEVEKVEVPGALEVPTAIRLADRSRRFDGYVALGCVIRGETTHYETVCNDSSRGLMLLGLDGLAIGNGILTVESMDQAVVRADPAAQNKGGGAAEAALHLIALRTRFAPASRQTAPQDEAPIRMAAADPEGGR